MKDMGDVFVSAVELGQHQARRRRGQAECGLGAAGQGNTAEPAMAGRNERGQ